MVAKKAISLKQFKHEMLMLITKFPWDESTLTDGEKRKVIVARLSAMQEKLYTKDKYGFMSLGE